MWDGVDRRKFTRVQYPCLITVRKETPPAFSILTHTENISMGGVRVIVKKRIEVTTEVGLEVDLQDTLKNVISKGTIRWVKKVSSTQRETSSRKDTDSKMLKGVVSWVKKVPAGPKGQLLCYDMGIQFIGLTDEDRQRIRNIVDRLVKKDSS